MALRNLINGTDFVVIDPEDEYRAVANTVGGQVIRLAASSPHRLNPFDLPREQSRGASVAPVLDDENPLAERVAALLGLLEIMLCGASGSNTKSASLDAYERAVLDRALFQTYATAGITTDIATHSQQAPLLRDLHRTLMESDGEPAASLATRLERYVEGSLAAGLFSGPTNVSLQHPFIVFHLRDLAEELRPLAIHLIAGHVWNAVRRNRRPRQLIVDEAAVLLGHSEGGAFLAKMARRARKYYLGLVTITQKVDDLTGSQYGDTVLTNAAMVLLLKQKAEIIEAADASFHLTVEERQWLLGADKGEGLLFVRGSRVPIQIVASPEEYAIATTNPRDLERQLVAATATPSGMAGASAQSSLGDVLAARAGWGNGRAAVPSDRREVHE